LINRLLVPFTQAASTHQSDVSFPQIIHCQDSPQQCSPSEEINSWWNLSFPNTFSRKHAHFLRC